MQAAKKVLVIDDKYYIRQLILTALGIRGFTVFAAADGGEGMEVAGRERPGVILLDLIMPGLDGYECLRLLRSNPATGDIPIVIMSARSDIDAGTSILSDADDFLPKPFDLELLYTIVDRYTSGAGRAGAPAAPPALDGAAQGEVAAGRYTTPLDEAL